jgi:hypothetical protein
MKLTQRLRKPVNPDQADCDRICADLPGAGCRKSVWPGISATENTGAHENE